MGDPVIVSRASFGPQRAVRPVPGDSAQVRVDDLLADVTACLEPHLAGLVDDLYDRLAVEPELRGVLALLTPEQFAHLKRAQADHVRLLLSPGMTDEALTARSRVIGRVHAMTGVAMDWYVDASGEHRTALLAALRVCGQGLDLELAQSVITDRFMVDLQGQLLGMRDLDDGHNAVLLKILDTAAGARTVADLVQGVVDALGGLEGTAVCMFARQAGHHEMATEVGGGPGFAAMLAEAPLHPSIAVTTDAGLDSGRGPVGRAWRSGRIERSDSMLNDPDSLPWRGLARRLGWGSSVAVPLIDDRGDTRALVSMQSYWPGYFAAPGRLAMLEQIQRVVQRALVGLEDRPTLSSGISNYQARAHHLDLLHQGRVQMLFQPLVALPSGRLSKLEALARLQGPGRLISPAEFLPAFGDDELFTLFEVGLSQSLEALRGWQGRGLTTGVSVNLPVQAAHDERYVRLVTEMLRRHEVDPGRLTLELLETEMADRESTSRHRSIDELEGLGVRLAQDDLGSGYSSLLRLRHFAFDDVKIDRGLVRGSERAPGVALHFIRPITTIAHSLGLTVVIEGLEDDGLIEAAVQLGVDEGQGFGIARPMPASQVLDWARTYRLEVDPLAPRTPLGGLAAHIAWEVRMTSGPDTAGLSRRSELDDCAMTRYLAGQGDPVAEDAHRRVHASAAPGRSTVEQREAWSALAARLDAG